MADSDPLASAAEELAQEVRGLSRRFRWLKHLTIGLAVSFAVDLTVTVVLATVVNNQADQNHRIKQALAQNYLTAQQQKQVRLDVLCPLYQLFIASVDDPNRTTGMTPAQRAKSDQAAVAIHAQYAKLGCAG